MQLTLQLPRLIPLSDSDYYSVPAVNAWGAFLGEGGNGGGLSLLGVLECEMYRRSGVRDHYWWYQLVKAITARSCPFEHAEYMQ